MKSKKSYETSMKQLAFAYTGIAVVLIIETIRQGW